MANVIFLALYFFLPAFIANMSPVFVKNIRFLDYPVDFNKKIKGKRILGEHKTWRGLFFGTLFGAIFFEIQRILYTNGMLKNLALIDYSTAPLFLGALIAFSALFGDSLKSFFKRRFGIRPGKPWVPFDQLDYILISLLITLPWTHLSLLSSTLCLGTVFILTMAVQYTGYKLKLKEDKL